MASEHYTEHIIYNRSFLFVIDEFKKLILKDDDVKKISTHEKQRFSAALRLLIMDYVLKKSQSQEIKEAVKFKKGVNVTLRYSHL